MSLQEGLQASEHAACAIQMRLHRLQACATLLPLNHCLALSYLNYCHLKASVRLSGPCLQLPEVHEYLEEGPSFIFLFHPSLGPLWDVVAQKVQGGTLAAKSELVLEVAEACLCNVHVHGSLQVQADSVMGRTEEALAVNYNQIRSRRDLQLHQLSTRSHR